MSKNTTIAAAVVAVIGIIAIAGVVVGINMTAETKQPSLGELTPIIPDTEIEVPEEEYIPQSYAPTNSFLEEGEVKYYGWKVDRTEPVVEEPEVDEPETPEKPELEPIKPIKPGCKHGYINPVFCPYC